MWHTLVTRMEGRAPIRTCRWERSAWPSWPLPAPTIDLGDPAALLGQEEKVTHWDHEVRRKLSSWCLGSCGGGHGLLFFFQGFNLPKGGRIFCRGCLEISDIYSWTNSNLTYRTELTVCKILFPLLHGSLHLAMDQGFSVCPAWALCTSSLVLPSFLCHPLLFPSVFT